MVGKLDVVVPSCNPSTWETEAGGTVVSSGQQGSLDHKEVISKNKMHTKIDLR